MSNYFRERAGLLTAPYESGMLDNARGRHLSGIAKYSLLFLLLKNSSLFLHVNILLELIFVDLYQCLVFSWWEEIRGREMLASCFCQDGWAVSAWSTPFVESDP